MPRDSLMISERGSQVAVIIREKKKLFKDFFDTPARSSDFRFQVKKETTRRRDGEITAYRAFLSEKRHEEKHLIARFVTPCNNIPSLFEPFL